MFAPCAEKTSAAALFRKIVQPVTNVSTLKPLKWYDSLKEYALTACLNGGTIPGWKAVEGRSTRAWADQDKALEIILAAGHPHELVFDTIPKSLTQLEKLIGAKPFGELVGDQIIKPPGKPALAPESDKRPAYSSAARDFAGLQETAS